MPTHPFGSKPKVVESPGGDEGQQPAEPGAGGAGEDTGEQQPGADTPAGGEQPGDPAASAEGESAADAERERKREYARARYRERADKLKAKRAAKAARAATRNSTEPAAVGRKSATQATLDLNHIIFSAHMMFAALLKSPNFVLTEDESKQLAAAINRVTELYDVPLLDEKSRAWINLGMVGVQVYGTRIAAEVVERKRRPKPSVPGGAIKGPQAVTPMAGSQVNEASWLGAVHGQA